MPSTVFLMCGFIGSGKTFMARELSHQHGALRLTLDEWVITLYGPDTIEKLGFDPQERIKILHLQLTEQAVSLGYSVILDWGFWTKVERDAIIERVGLLGVAPQIIFMDCDKQICRRRTVERNNSAGHSSVYIDLENFDKWWDLFEPPSENELKYNTT